MNIYDHQIESRLGLHETDSDEFDDSVTICDLANADVESADDYKWDLPGRGNYRDTCQQFKSLLVCSAGHKRVRRHSCFTYTCSRCFRDAARRAAVKISERLEQIRDLMAINYQSLYHWTFSPPQHYCRNYASMVAYRKRITNFFKKFYPQAGALIFFHSHRNKLRDDLHWEIGPHFHIITNIENMDTEALYTADGCVRKRIKVVQAIGTLIGLVSYELSHVALPRGHTLRHHHVWAGLWSYNQLACVKYEKIVTPKCNVKLTEKYEFEGKLHKTFQLNDDGEFIHCTHHLHKTHNVDFDEQLIDRYKGRYHFQEDVIKINSYEMDDDDLMCKCELRFYYPRKGSKLAKFVNNLNDVIEILEIRWRKNIFEMEEKIDSYVPDFIQDQFCDFLDLFQFQIIK